MTDGDLVLIGEPKMSDTVVDAITCFTCAMVLLPATEMIGEGDGMTCVAKG